MNNEFYPTPEGVIEKMLVPYKFNEYEYDLKNKVILEPSAGKGDILDFINKKARYQNTKLYCIEIDPDLQLILQGKGYKLIDKDFIEHKPDFNYDLILMNPPFNNGDNHLLKAWEILEQGDIVCLLNEETIKNPYTKTRQVLKAIIEEHGSIEYLGDCFRNSEHQTNVGVVLIRLKKTSSSNKFDFGDMQTEEIKFNDEYQENSIALRDTLDNICLQYDIVKNEYINLLKLKSKIKKYVDVLSDNSYSMQQDFGLKNINEDNLRDFLEKLKLSIWENIAKQTKLEKYMTNKVRGDFNSYINQQGNISITKENILDFIKVIWLNRGNIIESAIEEVFDIFTKYYKENRCYIEGWKTNDWWKVNKKIILPNWVKWGQYSDKDYLKTHGDIFGINYRSEYTDIDKVMCFITGKNIDQIITIHSALKTQFERLGYITSGGKFENTCSSEFFNIKFFKKGTIHIEFKDHWLWEEFNKRATKCKNWLPD